jgi:hypothetical protein
MYVKSLNFKITFLSTLSGGFYFFFILVICKMLDVYSTYRKINAFYKIKHKYKSQKTIYYKHQPYVFLHWSIGLVIVFLDNLKIALLCRNM